MALTREQQAEAIREIYRQARHTVDSRGGNLHTMLTLLGPELYRGLVAAELLKRLTEIKFGSHYQLRQALWSLHYQLGNDLDLDPEHRADEEITLVLRTGTGGTVCWALKDPRDQALLDTIDVALPEVTP
jgi:hypothetical protein